MSNNRDENYGDFVSPKVPDSCSQVINKFSLEVRRDVENELGAVLKTPEATEFAVLVPSRATTPTSNSIASVPSNSRTRPQMDIARCIEQVDRMDRAIRCDERRRHSRYIQNWLDDARFNLDRDPIIPLEQGPILSDKRPWLPRSLDKVVSAIAALTGLQYAGIAMAVLAALLIAVWGRVWVRINPKWRELAVIMLLQSAPSGSRKTLLANILRQAFDDHSALYNLRYSKTHQENKRAQNIASQIATGFTREHIHRKILATMDDDFSDMAHVEEFISKCLENETKILRMAPQEINLCTLLAGKCSPAGALKLLQENGGCLGCITDEADVLTSKLLNSTKEIPSLVLHGHTGQPISERNGHGGVFFPQVAFPMINIVQGSEMSKLYTNHRQIEQGLVHRFAPYVYGTPCNSKQIQAEELEMYNNKILETLNMCYSQNCYSTKFEVPVSKEGAKIIEHFRSEVDNYILPDMPISARPYCNKACGLVARLAFAIHVWNTHNPFEGEITAEEVEQACDLVYETFDHAHFAYARDGLSAQQDAIRIVSSLLKVSPNEDQYILVKGYDSRLIRQRLRLTPERIDNALRFLERYNALSVYDDSSTNLKLHLHHNFFTFFSQQNYN